MNLEDFEKIAQDSGHDNFAVLEALVECDIDVDNLESYQNILVAHRPQVEKLVDIALTKIMFFSMSRDDSSAHPEQ